MMGLMGLGGPTTTTASPLDCPLLAVAVRTRTHHIHHKTKRKTESTPKELLNPEPLNLPSVVFLSGLRHYQ
jgi:hypothetical protein